MSSISWDFEENVIPEPRVSWHLLGIKGGIGLKDMYVHGWESAFRNEYIVACQGGGVSSKTRRHGTDKTQSLNPSPAIVDIHVPAFSPLEKVNYPNIPT